MVKSLSTTSIEDRIESLKSALLAGTGAGLMTLLVLLGQRARMLGWSQALTSLLTGFSATSLWSGLAIAVCSGGLFGITYRYTVRQDANAHLKSGVVLAFALVRGLAQVDGASALSQGGWPFVVAITESLLLFGGAGALVELALRRGWVRSMR